MDRAVLVFLLLFLRLAAVVLTDGCDYTVDITDGEKVGESIVKDGLTYNQSNYFTNGSAILGCICNVKPCIRRCCLENEFLNVTSRSCVSLSVAATSDVVPYYIVYVPENRLCDEDEYRVKIDENFSVSEGRLTWEEDEYVLDDYCVDAVENASVAVLCISGISDINRWILCAGMIISMPFLLITFLVYAILPDSNIHRKALMFYVLTLLLSYIFLVIIQLYIGEIAPGFCHVLGYGVIFFFVASFFWMNVMCIDMWLAFSGIRGFAGQRNAEKKRFLLYCLYACGMPTLHVLLVLMLNHLGDETKTYYPGIGKKKCFLEDGIPSLLYFYGPMAVLIAVNVVLFVLTAVKIQKVKKETSMLKHSDNKRHSYEDDKQKFNLYLKLMFAMGVNWSMEVISWAFIWKMGTQVPTYIWYLTDFCNALYGVFIFFIFVFKKKIWRNLKKRYYLFAGKPHLAHSLTTTHTTRSISTADTMVNNDHRLSEFKNGREERPLTQN